MGVEGLVLIQVPLLPGPSTWLLLASVSITLSLVVSSYMECRVMVPPSLFSAAVEVGSPVHGHRTHKPKHTFLHGSHFLGGFMFSVSQSHLLLFGHMLV